MADSRSGAGNVQRDPEMPCYSKSKVALSRSWGHVQGLGRR